MPDARPRTEQPDAAIDPARALAGAWWRRAPLVLVRPREVFAALRSEDEADVEARQEPILAIVLLAGMAAVVLTPAWGTAMDESRVDGLVLAVLTFVGGGLSGAVSYYLLGLALFVGAKGVGSPARFRLSRHVLAFASVPLAASIVVTLPVGLASFGSDLFSSGGSDEGGGGAAWHVLGLVFVAWSLCLVGLGLRVTHRLAWLGVAGALALATVLVAALAVLPSVL